MRSLVWMSRPGSQYSDSEDGMPATKVFTMAAGMVDFDGSAS